MPDYPGVMIEKFTGSGETNGGRYAFVRCVAHGGEPLMLAMPKDLLLQVVDIAAKEMSRGQEGSFTKTVRAFDVKEFEVGTSEGRSGAMLSLRFGADGWLHFFLPSRMPEQLLDVLSVQTGRAA